MNVLLEFISDSDCSQALVNQVADIMSGGLLLPTSQHYGPRECSNNSNNDSAAVFSRQLSHAKTSSFFGSSTMQSAGFISLLNANRCRGAQGPLNGIATGQVTLKGDEHALVEARNLVASLEPRERTPATPSFR